MELRSLVVRKDEIELSLGNPESEAEHVFIRFPLPDEDCMRRSLQELHLATLYRARDAIEFQIGCLQNRGGSPP